MLDDKSTNLFSSSKKTVIVITSHTFDLFCVLVVSHKNRGTLLMTPKVFHDPSIR